MDVEGSGAGRGGWLLNGCRAAALIEEECVWREMSGWWTTSQRLTGGMGEVRGNGAPGVLCSWIGEGKKWQTCGSSVRTALYAAGGMYTCISCTGCSTSTRSQFMICP